MKNKGADQNMQSGLHSVVPMIQNQVSSKGGTLNVFGECSGSVVEFLIISRGC